MKVLVTGGAGFIGSNLVHHLLGAGHEVLVLDNLSRRGSRYNAEWLREQHGDRFRLVQADVRDYPAVRDAARGAERIYHFAAQVAVTTSVTDPVTDFQINAGGALNMLEAARHNGANPVIVFTSTNKVYGAMEDLATVDQGNRYMYRDLPLGVSEARPLDFHSPYGCSKGAADQYVRDYSRIYGLRTIVFRMSCIYGTRQFGNEDQGWVAHFIISAVLGRPLSIYGDGKQVRDLLFVEDLVRAFLAAPEHAELTAGQIFNIGGGAANTLSLLELIALLEEKLGRKIPLDYGDWRPGDQPVYVSDTRRAQATFGWEPRVSCREGVERLLQWVLENRTLF